MRAQKVEFASKLLHATVRALIGVPGGRGAQPYLEISSTRVFAARGASFPSRRLRDPRARARARKPVATSRRPAVRRVVCKRCPEKAGESVLPVCRFFGG